MHAFDATHFYSNGYTNNATIRSSDDPAIHAPQFAA
jgi:hypothetical protein